MLPAPATRSTLRTVDEQELAGGNNTREVTRVGDTVRRSRGTGAAFAAQVLLHLASVQFPFAPRWLGVDLQGRDVLSYVPGETTNHPDQRAAGAYCRAGRILHQLHDATAGHLLAAGAECVIHGDPGPFNMICRDGLPVALIDWDSARPGARLDDLAYLAWTWCIQSTGNVPISDQARHLRELRDGYGDIAGDLLSAILGRQAMIAGAEAINRDDPNLSPSRRAHAQRAIAWATADHNLVQCNLGLLRTALS